MIRPTFSSPYAWLAAAFVCLVSRLTAAQTPTAEQIQMFQNLPASQQEALLESVGRGSGNSNSSSRDSGRSDDREPRNGGLESRTGDNQDFDALSLLGSETETRFKANDTLLLSVEIRQFKGPEPLTPPPVPTEAKQEKPGASASDKKQPAATTGDSREPIKRTEAESKRLEDLRTRLLRRNPLKLDKWGLVSLPELGSIPLAGLTPEEATKRIAAEPLLADFIVEVTYLPVNPVGVAALKPFGYDLFKKRPPSTFAPVNDIPVPAEYVVGPGDTLEVQLVGNTKGRYSLVVRRDGQVSFPELGAISVGGMRFEEVRTLLESRVSDRLIGTQASVQMGRLRSIQVFIAGDARQPGSYTISALSTITNALFVSGGVKEIGSLRNIELKRDGRTIARLDLYDLLLSGDTHADARLQSGDVIFIPTVARMAGVTGEVKRPALYELKNETTIAELIRLAGGLNAEADSSRATISHIDSTRQRVVLDIDLTRTATAQVANGDIVQVPEIRSTVQDSIVVQGHVLRPGQFQYRSGLRISDVIGSLAELSPTADQHYVLIRREVPPTNRLEFVSADLAKALERKGSDADVPLAPRDQIFVFDLESGRDRLMQPLLRELRLQSSRDAPTAEVSIGGRINAPGEYPLEKDMRVSDLIRAGGALNEAAYGGKAELTRNVVSNGEERKTQLIEIDLARALGGDPTADIVLQPFDYLIIKELPLWGAQEYVDVAGEVRFPGRYPVQRGETLRSVVQRAGGVTDLAFVEGAVFTRETLKERERKQLEDLKRRMQTDLAQVSLMAAQEAGGNAAQALSVGQQVLDNLDDAEPVGRLVINLDGAMTATPGSAKDVVLKDGDKLMVPRVTQEITVIGEVQSPTSHLFSEGLSRNDYIAMSGGATQRADKRRVYVVRADGSVVGASGNRWFSGEVEIRPGDTIVVPLDAERMRALPLWTSVTQIIYYLAVSVAAISSFN